MNQIVIEETAFEEVLSEIEENSKYKRLPPMEKTWMTVPEMGNLLGLKKTGRYWLVQKNYFECREIAGQMRVVRKSGEVSESEWGRTGKKSEKMVLFHIRSCQNVGD